MRIDQLQAGNIFKVNGIECIRVRSKTNAVAAIIASGSFILYVFRIRILSIITGSDKEKILEDPTNASRTFNCSSVALGHASNSIREITDSCESIFPINSADFAGSLSLR